MGWTKKSSGTSLNIIVSRAWLAIPALRCEALLVSRLIFLYCFCFVQAVSYVPVHVVYPYIFNSHSVQYDTACFCKCLIFFPIFDFYYRVNLHQWPHFIFSPQFLIIFSMGLIFNFLKQNTDGQEQKVFWLFLDLNIGLLATFWESRVLGSEDGRSGRRYIFCSLCFQPLPIARWYFLSQNYACFPFFSFSWRLSKNFCSFVFSIKSWTKLNNLWRNNTNNPVHNIRTYLLILSQ